MIHSANGLCVSVSNTRISTGCEIPITYVCGRGSIMRCSAVCLIWYHIILCIFMVDTYMYPGNLPCLFNVFWNICKRLYSFSVISWIDYWQYQLINECMKVALFTRHVLNISSTTAIWYRPLYLQKLRAALFGTKLPMHTKFINHDRKLAVSSSKMWNCAI